MTTLNEPYFMSNKEWYYHDEIEWEYKLTEKATKKAEENYKEFYKMLNQVKINE